VRRRGSSEIDLRVTTKLPRSEAIGEYEQFLADLRVRSDRPLDPYRTSATVGPPQDDETDPPASVARRDSWSTVYDGPGLIRGREERIRSLVRDDGRGRIVFADGETYDVTAEGHAIERTCPGGTEWNVERVLGAPFALAGARRGLYLLHASAIADDDGHAIALVAESGGGKSTLAEAAERESRGFRRIADDQLPVRLGNRPTALPRFPQLKLSREEQFCDSRSSSFELVALVELRLSSGALEPRVTRLSRRETAHALVRATVAARVFDPGALAAHFERCVESTQALTGYELELPVDLARLDEGLARLAALPR
jgi:hypothetical protein